jgi:hypothetical protein
MARAKSTGWIGWIVFASVIMLLEGSLQAIQGLVAIFKDDFYVVARDRLIAFDFTTWGWIHLAIGVLVFFAGMALLSGRLWGRTVAVVLAVLSAMAQLTFLDAYPVWAVIIIALDILIIYAITMHGTELR